MAKKWTKADLARLAVEIRKVDVGLTEYERFCPYGLAEEHGTAVYTLEDLAAYGCPQPSIDYFTVQRPETWSAALIPDGTGRVILENPVHRPRRRRSNVAHEMAHLLLEHNFNCVLLGDGQSDRRDPASQLLEKEAAELAAELLLPAAAAVRAAVAGQADEQVADTYDVSTELARWRLNVSGARKIAARTAKKRSFSFPKTP